MSPSRPQGQVLPHPEMAQICRGLRGHGAVSQHVCAGHCRRAGRHPPDSTTAERSRRTSPVPGKANCDRQRRATFRVTVLG